MIETERPLTPSESEHLVRLRLMDVEIEGADAWLWLNEPHPELEGQTPARVIAAGERARVEPIIDQIEDDMWTELEGIIAQYCAL